MGATRAQKQSDGTGKNISLSKTGRGGGGKKDYQRRRKNRGSVGGEAHRLEPIMEKNGGEYRRRTQNKEGKHQTIGVIRWKESRENKSCRSLRKRGVG